MANGIRCGAALAAVLGATLFISGVAGAAPATLEVAGSSYSSQGNAYAAAVIGDRPLAYWRLDETGGAAALDTWGPNPGFYRHDPQLGSPSLLLGDPDGHSVRFGDDDERVAVPPSRSLEPGQRVSVEAWIDPQVLPEGRALAVIAGAPGAYALLLEGGRLSFAIGCAAHGGERLSAPTGLFVGEIHHVVATYDGRVARLFVDGASVAGRRLPAPPPAAAHRFEIGSSGRGREQFDGAIDEVAVYARPLTPAQVSDHYRAGAWPLPNS